MGFIARNRTFLSYLSQVFKLGIWRLAIGIFSQAKIPQRTVFNFTAPDLAGTAAMTIETFSSDAFKRRAISWLHWFGQPPKTIRIEGAFCWRAKPYFERAVETANQTVHSYGTQWRNSLSLFFHSAPLVQFLNQTTISEPQNGSIFEPIIPPFSPKTSPNWFNFWTEYIYTVVLVFRGFGAWQRGQALPLPPPEKTETLHTPTPIVSIFPLLETVLLRNAVLYHFQGAYRAAT